MTIPLSHPNTDIKSKRGRDVQEFGPFAKFMHYISSTHFESCSYINRKEFKNAATNAMTEYLCV